jgi:hypothetical protein
MRAILYAMAARWVIQAAVVLVLLIFGVGSAEAAPQYTLTDLGVIPEQGGNFS